MLCGLQQSEFTISRAPLLSLSHASHFTHTAPSWVCVGVCGCGCGEERGEESAGAGKAGAEKSKIVRK